MCVFLLSLSFSRTDSGQYPSDQYSSLFSLFHGSHRSVLRTIIRLSSIPPGVTKLTHTSVLFSPVKLPHTSLTLEMLNHCAYYQCFCIWLLVEESDTALGWVGLNYLHSFTRLKTIFCFVKLTWLFLFFSYKYNRHFD